MDSGKIENFSARFLKQMLDEDIGMNEAKAIANRMIHVLDEAEKYRPDTPPKKIINHISVNIC